MDKKTNLKNIFTKDYKYENYILFALSIIGIILSFLIFLGALELKLEGIDSNMFCLIMFALSIIALIMSIMKIKKEKATAKLMLYNDFIELYKNDKLKNKLNVLGIDYPIELEYLNAMKSLFIIVKINESVDAYLCLRKEEYDFSLDFNALNNMAEIVSDEDDELIANVNMTFKINEEMTVENTINKFQSFVNEQEKLASNIYEKYKDKIAYEEENENI